MLLDVGDKKYAVHFTHLCDSYIDGSQIQGMSSRGAVVPRWQTNCSIHEGVCTVKGCALTMHTYVGISFCHPNDQFSKRVGRKMALARALAPLPRNLRQQIWDAYFLVSPHR